MPSLIDLVVRSSRLAPFVLVAALAAPVLAVQDPASPLDDPAAAEAPEDDPAVAGDLPLEADQVKTLQLELKARGFFFGPADGRKGPRTRTALRNFQRAEGLAVTGSLDQETVDRLSEPARQPAPADRPAADAPSEPRREAGQNGGGNMFGKVGGGIKKGLGAIVGAGKTAGRTTGKAGGAVGKAGSVTATATTAATQAAANAVATAAKVTAVKVADTSVGLYETSKRKIVGERRTDDDIRRSIESQYAEDDRLAPEEIEVRVSSGNVTLSFPPSPRSNIDHAVRLAKLTPGVRSVSTVTAAASPAEARPDDVLTPAPDAPPSELPRTSEPAQPPPHR